MCKVNKDKEENSAMSTEISGSVDTDRCLRSLTLRFVNTQ